MNETTDSVHETPPSRAACVATRKRTTPTSLNLEKEVIANAKTTTPPVAPASSTSVAPSALASMQMLRLQFTHELEEDAELDIFKGAVWHGVFGLALKSVDEEAYTCLFEPVQRAAFWRLIPPGNTEARLHAGSSLSASIILFNDAIAHAPACAMAIMQMGNHGFGWRRSHARLESLTGHIGDQPASLQTLFSLRATAECGVTASAIFSSTRTAIPEHFAMNLISPLALKIDGQIQREPPSMEVVITRLLGRLVGLLPTLTDGFLAPIARVDLLHAAAAVRMSDADVCWFAWERYSGRQKSSMPFGGLVGQIRYQGDPRDVATVLPWLRLAEWLGIGSKTTFGQGQIALDFAPQPVNAT